MRKVNYSILYSVDNGVKTEKELMETFGKNKVTFKMCNVSQEQDWNDLWNHAESYFKDQVNTY